MQLFKKKIKEPNKIIAIHPYSNKSNKYVDLIIDILTKNSYTVIPTIKMLADFNTFSHCHTVYLNWFENIEGRLDFISKISFLLIAKLTRKRIIWTMHNKEPHDTSQIRYKRFLLFFIVYICDNIIVHSKESESFLPSTKKRIRTKVYYVPHPNYIDVYEDNKQLNDYQSKITNTNTTLNLLFIGAIKPYKNIELLIDVISQFKPGEVFLTLAGYTDSEEYRKKIRTLCQEKSNINFHDHFIEDNEICRFIKSSDLVILPYDTRSSLNSGTALLAFSLKRTVICPKIATITDFDNTENILTYTYNSHECHRHMLFSRIQEALLLKKNDSLSLIKMGEAMYNKVKEKNSHEIFESKLLTLLNF